jgi:hypothetical protein
MKKYKAEPQDIALDAFRGHFRAPITDVVVSDDGKTMRIGQNLSDRVATELWLNAQWIIDTNYLPLKADVQEWKAGSVIFDRFLVVEYLPAMERICQLKSSLYEKLDCF